MYKCLSVCWLHSVIEILAIVSGLSAFPKHTVIYIFFLNSVPGTLIADFLSSYDYSGFLKFRQVVFVTEAYD